MYVKPGQGQTQAAMRVGGSGFAAFRLVATSLDGPLVLRLSALHVGSNEPEHRFRIVAQGGRGHALPGW
jgi:hypothetical protein